MASNRPIMMGFIDGENIVSRYQAMLAAGRQPSNATLYHRPDVYVWNRLALYYVNHGHETVSVTYYTSAVADHDEIETIEQELRVLDVAQQHRETLDVYLTPFVKKRSRNQRVRRASISACVWTCLGMCTATMSTLSPYSLATAITSP